MENALSSNILRVTVLCYIFWKRSQSGCVFDFRWRLHYQQASSKAYKVLGLFHRVFSSTSTRAKLILYTSLVHPKLLYCSVVWHTHLLANIKCLELVQRRTTKFIFKSTDLDYRQRLIELATPFSLDDGV